MLHNICWSGKKRLQYFCDEICNNELNVVIIFSLSFLPDMFTNIFSGVIVLHIYIGWFILCKYTYFLKLNLPSLSASHQHGKSSLSPYFLASTPMHILCTHCPHKVHSTHPGFVSWLKLCMKLHTPNPSNAHSSSGVPKGDIWQTAGTTWLIDAYLKLYKK